MNTSLFYKNIFIYIYFSKIDIYFFMDYMQNRNVIKQSNVEEDVNMKWIGNLIWFIFFGWWTALIWLVFGILWCITIIGIPLGSQCFKFAALSLFPFGKEIVLGGGGFSTIANIIWILLPGFELAISYLIAGFIFYITIIGIPFGKQCFKLAKLSLMPFGAHII